MERELKLERELARGTVDRGKGKGGRRLRLEHALVGNRTNKGNPAADGTGTMGHLWVVWGRLYHRGWRCNRWRAVLYQTRCGGWLL